MISSIDMTELREQLLTKIDTAQSLKSQKDDEARINALRNSVTNDLYQQAIDNAQSESKIFEYLFFKYGTRLIVSTKMLEELETCKAPSSDTLESFLVNAVVISEFVA